MFLSETEGYRKIRKHREVEHTSLYFTGDVIKVIKQRDITGIVKQRDIQGIVNKVISKELLSEEISKALLTKIYPRNC